MPKNNKKKRMKTYHVSVDKNIIKTKCQINKLNDNCLSHIFSHLPILQIVSLNQVCKKWQIAQPLTWYQISKLELDVESLPFKENEKKLIFMQNVLSLCGQYLEHLIYKNLLWDEKTITTIIIQKCCNLTIFECHLIIDDDCELFFKNLCMNMKKLKVLKIFEKYNKVKIREKTLCADITLTQKLWKCFISSTAITILAHIPTTIEKIAMINLNEYSIELNELPLEKLTSIKCLTLDNYEISNDIIKKIKNTKTIKYLDLQNCCLSSPQLLTDLYNLEYLNICKVQYINSELLANITSKLRDLKYLKIETVSSMGDDPEFPVSLEELGECQSLENLDIHYVDSSILNAITKCKKLKNLYIQQYFHKSMSLKEFDHLESLAIRWPDDINVDFIRKIANDCPKLTSLCLSCCPSSDILNEIPKQLNNLVKLDLRENNHVDDNLLIKISSLKNLKMLSCQSCPNVTNIGVHVILKNCDKLERFNVDGCPRINSNITSIIISETSKRKNNIILYFQLDKNFLHGKRELHIHFPCLRFIIPNQNCTKKKWSPFD